MAVHRRGAAGAAAADDGGRMIHDVDETLRAMIKRDVVNGSGVDISFEAPTKEWAAKRTTPTVNVYLYDIREDTSRRETQFEEVRDENGRVVERRQPPRRFRLSYLLTAWTQRPEDEHRLLSSLLGTFLRADLLPEDVLAGSLRDAGRPTITQVALPPADDRSISDVWSALGGELKPSLDLVVIAPFVLGRSEPVGPPVTETPRIRVSRPEATAPEVLGSGRRRKKGASKAQDEAAEALAAATEADREAARRGTPGAPAEAPLAQERFGLGAEDDPGRVFHVRELPRRHR
jgi:hypothetical protein